MLSSFVAAASTVLLVAVGGCGAGSTHHSAPARYTVRAVLVSHHADAHGQWRTFRAPLSGFNVLAVASDGNRLSAAIDEGGNAVLHLQPGKYTLTTSFANACYPARVVVTSGDNSTVRLNCAAP
jgi:hypothetical protein